MSDPDHLTVLRTDFVSLPVTDIERSTAFYENILELPRVPGARGWPEFDLGNVSLYLVDPTQIGQSFTGPHSAHIALRVADVSSARALLEARGVVFGGDIFDTGVCHMAFFTDPDGNALMLHRRYAPHADGRTP